MKKLSEYDWFCDNCHSFLNAQIGFNAYCKHWKCTDCGHINKIAKSEIIFDNEDDFLYESEDEIPEGCAACGGPYPYCKTSCKIFDDSSDFNEPNELTNPSVDDNKIPAAQLVAAIGTLAVSIAGFVALIVKASRK